VLTPRSGVLTRAVGRDGTFLKGHECIDASCQLWAPLRCVLR
jgi:hypothetical protein